MDSVEKLFFDQGTIEDFKSLLASDPDKLMKLLFYIRDKKYGSGHRKLFINLFTISCILKPTNMRYIELIPKYGRWKDLAIMSTMEEKLVPIIGLIFSIQLKTDLLTIRGGGKISNASKWVPTPRRKNRNHPLVKELMKILDLNEEGLRKRILSPLRHYLGVVEIKLSKKCYDEINHKQLPALARKKYMDTFWRNDYRFEIRIKFNDVVEIVREVIKGYEQDVTSEWNRLSKCKLSNNIAVICDTNCKHIDYMIATALSFSKSIKYTYEIRPKVIPLNSPYMSKKIAAFADVKSSPVVLFDGIEEEIIYVLTGNPMPPSLKQRTSKIIVWWNLDSKVISITNHNNNLIEINGFHLKILKYIIKGGFPKLSLIVNENLKRYDKI